MIRKILIVEDEEDVIELLSAIFSELGNYRVLYARDGEEALKIARANTPDVVILDIQIPGLNGYEICKLVKSDPTINHAKIIMLSGMTQNFDWPKTRETGADGYIVKPFSVTTLIEKIEELLRSN